MLRVIGCFVTLALVCVSCNFSPGKGGELKEEAARSLNLSLGQEPILDPRKACDPSSKNMLAMVFDGLTRASSEGEVQLSVARSVDISKDGLSYVFTLRKSYWSNQEPLTAYDFEYAWKSALNPDSYFPAASALFIIKNARQVKEGSLPLESVGIVVHDAQTLEVVLEKPHKDFLSLVANTAFFPVNRYLDQRNPLWAEAVGPDFISNGPFVLSNWGHFKAIEVVKNKHYWDEAVVNVDKITLTMLDNKQELTLFKKGELDWIGFPLSQFPEKDLNEFAKQDSRDLQPVATTQWLQFNKKKFPFDHSPLRKAFIYAVQRKLVVNPLTQNQSLKMVDTSFDAEDVDVIVAKKLFKQSLEEIGWGERRMPVISFLYPQHGYYKRIAESIKQQWEELFDVDILLTEAPLDKYNEILAAGDYFVACNPSYEEESPTVGSLEAVPFYFQTYPFVKQDRVKNVLITDKGLVDFKWTSIE